MIFYVGAGSNGGDRAAHLLKALSLLKKEAKVLAVAPLFENPPLLPESAPEDWYHAYLNTVFKIEWTQSPTALLDCLNKIETLCGRVRTERWAPRILDLDILACDDGTPTARENLTIPHPHVLDRAFTLNPLSHLSPRLAIGGRSVLQAWRAHARTVPYLMGAVNCTPDSFSNSKNEPSSVDQMKALLESHVPIIDLGAESTRPGAISVSSAEEIERLRPALEFWSRAKSENPWTSVSIDTRHAETARFALEHGASILNDVAHLSDPAMLEIASAFDHVVFMHSLTVPADKSVHLDDGTPVQRQLFEWCERKLESFSKLPLDKLIFDPGIGFNKTWVQSLRILQNLEIFSSLPVRLLIGHSRKSFMNLWTRRSFPDRDWETVGASLAIARPPVNILRVHGVDAHQRALMSYQCLTTPL